METLQKREQKERHIAANVEQFRSRSCLLFESSIERNDQRIHFVGNDSLKRTREVGCDKQTYSERKTGNEADEQS